MKADNNLRRATFSKILIAGLVGLLVSACAETQLIVHGAKEIARVTDKPVAKTKGDYKIGKPYRIKGTWYYPAEDFNYVETGIASWYGPKFHGRLTANGETFDMNALSAAHRTLPMPSVVRVINLKNGRSLMLRVNDRGPFARGRIIDLSRRAAQLLGFRKQGTAPVRVEIIADESQRLKLLAMRGTPPSQQQIAATEAANRRAVQSQPLSSPKAPSKAPSIKVASTDARWPEIPPEKQTVRQSSPKQTKLFVQVGAYVDFVNASRARTRLSKHGAAWLAKAKIGRREFYRVRIGPMLDLDAADAMLNRLISAGFHQARIIVD